MRTSRPPAACWARRSTSSGGPSTNRKLVPLGKSIVGCGWWLMTNTGVRNGGSSPHQPRHPPSGQSPTWGPNLRRPMISAPMPWLHMLVRARTSVTGASALIDNMDYPAIEPREQPLGAADRGVEPHMPAGGVAVEGDVHV